MALAQWLLHNKLSKNTFGSERNELNWKWSYVYRPPTVKLVKKIPFFRYHRSPVVTLWPNFIVLESLTYLQQTSEICLLPEIFLINYGKIKYFCSSYLVYNKIQVYSNYKMLSILSLQFPLQYRLFVMYYIFVNECTCSDIMILIFMKEKFCYPVKPFRAPVSGWKIYEIVSDISFIIHSLRFYYFSPR